MALDVYFKDDIAQEIASVVVSMLSTAIAHGGSNVEYCRGVLDMARAQAVNYGIAWPPMLAELRATLSGDEPQALLDLAAPYLPAGLCGTRNGRAERPI